MNAKQQISHLTVEELQTLIRTTVHEAMVEVLVEMSAAAQLEAEIDEQAELAEFLRYSLRESAPGLPFPMDALPAAELDD